MEEEGQLTMTRTKFSPKAGTTVRRKAKSPNVQESRDDSLDYQQGNTSKIIKPNRQKGEDNQKRAGGNPQPTQPTATDTHSIVSSPKPTAAKHKETLTDTQTTVTSPQLAAAKYQQTAADTQTIVVSPQPTAAKFQQTAADTQTTVVSPQLTAAKSQPTTGDTQPIRTSPLPTAAKSQHTVADTQPIGSCPQPTAADTQTTGVNPKPIGGNLQQIGDNPQHKDLSETKSKDIGEEGQITMKHNNSSPKENTTHRREASSHHGQENRDEGADGDVDQQVEEPVYKDSRSTRGQTYNNKRAFPEANPNHIRNRQPGIPEKTKAGQPVRNDKKERTYGIPKQTGSRSEFSDDEQYDMTEANRIEKSRSRTDMDDWTNQLWTHLINAIVTVIVCVIFMIVYSQWDQVLPVSTKDNSHESKQPMPMEKVIMDLRNENEKYNTMPDDISSKLMTSDKAVDNLQKEDGELENSFKTMTESNTGTLEEIRKNIDNNRDKLSENREQLERVKTDISAITINLEEKLRQQDNNGKETIQEIKKEVSKILREMDDKIKKIEEEMSSTSETIKKAEEAKAVLQDEVNNTRRVDNLNEKFGELEKSVKAMTEINTGMHEELRRKIDNNSDKLSEKKERIEQVKTDISSTRNDLEEMLRRQDNDVKKTIRGNNKELKKMNAKKKKIEDEMSSTSETIKKAEEAKTVLQNEVNNTRRVDNLNEKFGELEKGVKIMRESNNGMLEELRRKIDNDSDKLNENRERNEQVKTDISAKTINLEERLRQQNNNCKETIQKINKAVRKIQREMYGKIKKIEEEMNSTSEIIKKAEEAKAVLQDEVKNIDEIVAFLKANAFNKSVMLNIVVFLTIAVFALIIGMWIIWNRVSFDHHGNTPRHGSGTNPRMSVIEQVTKNPPLTNTICFISYGQTNESFNHKLVHKLMGQLSQPLQDTPVRGHLINSHADIANYPHCKLFFMCVEFSTRHVIIEEPGIGQGDIRRTTYDAVRKLGATLLILYTRDHDSRQLRDGLRYQSKIYCVASQSELKVLDDKNCFYSVFDSFTPFQVEQLKDVIRNALQ